METINNNRKGFDWSDNVLGLPLIKIRDFLRKRKFSNISEQDVSAFFKEVDPKSLIKELQDKNLIRKVDKDEKFDCNNGREPIKDFYITDSGIKLTTSNNTKKRSKSYCSELIKDIKNMATELNNITSCPEYIKEIKVYGSYLYKNENELLNDLDLIIITGRKYSELNEDKYLDFCTEYNLYTDYRICYHNAVQIFIYRSIKKRNPFLHILLNDLEDGYKYETIFKDDRYNGK